MKKIAYNPFPLFLLVCCGISMTACKKDKKSVAASVALPIEVAMPEVRDVTLTEEYPGYLQAFNTVNLVARVPGALQQVLYTPGVRVNKGQSLFVIEPTTYIDNVKQAEAALGEAKASLEYNKATYERTLQAAAANAVSEIQVIQTRANYEQSIASVKNYEAQLANAKTNLGYCYITAPFTGRVSKNQYDVGNYLNGAPTLATLYQDDKIYVNFSVADDQYLNMAVRTDKIKELKNLPQLTVLPNDESDLPPFKATLDYFAPNIQLSTGTINMRGLIDNTEGLLRDGLYVKVILPYGEKKNAVLIPDASIGTDQLGRFIYVVNDSAKVEPRRVELGQLISDSLRIINKGLLPGERYVTNALLKVRAGMTVDPILKGAASKGEASQQKTTKKDSGKSVSEK